MTSLDEYLAQVRERADRTLHIEDVVIQRTPWIAQHATDAIRLLAIIEAQKKALLLARDFIRGKANACRGRRHDCPSCDGAGADDTLAELEEIAKGEL